MSAPDANRKHENNMEKRQLIIAEKNLPISILEKQGTNLFNNRREINQYYFLDEIICGNNENIRNNDVCDYNCSTYEYTFHNNWTRETVSTKYNLICDRKSIQNDMSTVGLAGLLVGALIFGNLSDIWGRKQTMILAATLAGVVSLLTTWLTSYSIWFYMIGRLLMFACVHGSQLAQFCYIMEMLPPLWRTPLGIMVQAGFSFGFMSLSFLAMVFDNWQAMMLSLSLYPFLILILVPFIPESYRWYLSRGYHTAGVAALSDYTKKCGHQIDETGIDKLISIENDNVTEEDNKKTMGDLFRLPATRITTLKMIYLWIVITMVYYSFALGKIPGSLLVNNVINGVLEVGTLIPMAVLINKPWFYRSRGLAALLFLTAAASLLCGLMLKLQNEDGDIYEQVARYAAFFGRSVISMCFGLVYIYAGEIFPTAVRNSGVGLSSMGGRIGGMIAPQVAKFAVAPFNIIWLPNVIFTSLTIIGGFICLSLPETSGEKLLQTLDEAETFYQKKRKFNN